MSGNPFRASLLHKHPAAAPIPPTSFIQTYSDSDSSRPKPDARERWESDPVLDDASPPPHKIKKSVRIESPTEPYSPHSAVQQYPNDSLLQRVNQSKHAGSPPPVSPAGFSDNFDDIIAEESRVQSSGQGGQLHVREMTANSWRSQGVPDASPSSPGAPVNPFARTLATMELQEKGSGEPAQNAGHNRDRTGAERANVRVSLDVEGFKNLLMTGSASPRHSGQSPHTGPGPNNLSAPIFESGSSTDTSSVSRQSIFEPIQEPHIETPRTSYEMPASEDDERMGINAEMKKEKKKPPPAPKHRHGKLVTSRQPQTVSFSDFAANEATASPVLRARTNSDLNKPLPPPPTVTSPPVHIISQDITQDELPPLEPKASELSLQSSIQSDATPPPKKKAPPPVPISRRHSQLKTSMTGGRSRSNSSLTVSSQHSTELTISTSGPTSDPSSPPSALKSPPPPPPSRRHRAELASLNTSSAHSSTTELPATSKSRRSDVSSPNAPRSTAPATDSPPPDIGLNRSPSISSTRSKVHPPPNEGMGQAMPPPPPPPRRRQSNRSSLDQQRPYPLPASSPTESRRTSSEHKRNSFDSKRRTSVNSESSLRYEYAPTEEKGNNEYALYSPQEEHENKKLGVESEAEPEHVKTSSTTILDDMEKFQREIDELREKYKK